MKRLHVHVSVDNLSDSIRFYSLMFEAEPTVRKNDYAKWMLEDPRVNFAISQRGSDVGLNHLGIQVESDAELGQMRARLETLQPGVAKEEGAACCYAKSDKYWLTDPSGIAWETFHTLDSIPVFGDEAKTGATESCCVPAAVPVMLTKRPPPAGACGPSQETASASGKKCC